MPIMDKKYVITMPDHTRWEIPVSVIAWHRAKHQAEYFEGNFRNSLKEGTIPLFTQRPYEIEGWAKKHMNWSDVKNNAVQIASKILVDYQEGWQNGPAEITP